MGLRDLSRAVRQRIVDFLATEAAGEVDEDVPADEEDDVLSMDEEEDGRQYGLVIPFPL